MRSSCGRVRASGCRRGGLAASLTIAALDAVLGLAACGDNLAPPRLTAARYVFDDGSSQVDHRELYDLDLETLCEPTLFSDGSTYCKPATDVASFADDRCIHPIGRVPAGQAPKPYFATTYTLGGERTISRIFHTGAPRTEPLLRYERQDNLCVAYPIDDGFDYYDLGAEVTDLARVRFEQGEVMGSWQVDELVADGLRIPWRLTDTRYGECDVLEHANSGDTRCHPIAAVEITYYADAHCYMPIITAPSRPKLAWNGNIGCAAYFEPGNDVAVDSLYQQIGPNCVESSPTEPLEQFTVGASAIVGSLSRQPEGSTTRLWRLMLSPTPLEDDVMNDTMLGQQCRRDAQGRCVPVGAASVESWFSDPLCSQPIEVAMVGRPCEGAPKFARKDETFYPVLDVYAAQLYQLDTGDTCSTYTPPNGLVAHSIGPALGADAFARATLSIE